MSIYPNNKLELFKIKTRDDEIRDLKYIFEKHDYQNILKSFKIDREYYKKKQKSLNEKGIYDCLRNVNRICWIRCR